MVVSANRKHDGDKLNHSGKWKWQVKVLGFLGCGILPVGTRSFRKYFEPQFSYGSVVESNPSASFDDFLPKKLCFRNICKVKVPFWVILSKPWPKDDYNCFKAQENLEMLK